MNVPARDIAKLFGGEKVLGRKVRDYADLDAVIEAGLPEDAVRSLSEAVVSVMRVRRKAKRDFPAPVGVRITVHGTDEPVTHGRSLGGLLRATVASPERSRKLERLARLYALAERVIDDRDFANAFLHKPHSRLNGRAPIACVETELATKQVEQILNSIAYGLPA